MRCAPGIAIVLLLVACGGDPAPVDGGADASGGEDAGTDAGSDAGPPGPRFCQPCRLDPQCGEGNQCLYFGDDTTGCGRGCATDADCAGLPVASRCLAPIEGLPTQCMPEAGTCATVPMRTPCTADAECGGTYDRCVDGLDPAGPICTVACESDADCPFLARRCVQADGGAFCAPDPGSSVDVCRALIDAGALEACGAGGACPSGTSCRTSGDLAVCLRDAAGGSCPADHVLAGDACLPSIPGGTDLLGACACAVHPDASMLDDALAAIDHDRCDIAFPTATYRMLYAANDWIDDIAQDPFRLSTTDALHGDWLGVPAIATRVASELDDAAGDTAAMLGELAGLADLGTEPPVAGAAGALGEELAMLVSAAGGTPDRADIDAQVAALPAGSSAALAPIVRAVRLAVIAREEALAIHIESDRRALFATAPGLHLGAGTGATAPPTSAWVQGALRGDVDLDRMAGAARGIARAVEDADLGALAGSTASLTIDTPAGRIAIRGSGADTYEGDGWSAILLAIDAGGDDVYRAPVGANASIANGVSVAIDLGGSDRYGYVEIPVADDVGPAGHERLPSDGAGRAAIRDTQGPFSLSDSARQGAGRLGIGMLFDLGVAHDEYRSLRMSQGYGALGVGVLVDEGGDDLYHGEAGVQGAASFGIGLLLDRGGTDRYVAYHAAQGFAYSRAVGLLYDATGDDTYFSHPSDVLYYSPQDPGGSNSSFSQGAGFGRRADFSDGVFMSGGIAILRDRDGADRYTTGIFGQATGYWFGTGFLLEGGGADHYDGQWYVQAGDAHYAIAALIDEGGNDDYNALARRMNAALAGGHDFSAAWVVDREGDDVWRAPNLAFGVGHAGGFGGFVDAAGTDSYETTSQLTFGNASIETPGDGLRRLTGTVGVFLERGGVDTYVRPTVDPVANDAMWTQEAHTGENEHGAGIDRASGDVGLPGLTL